MQMAFFSYHEISFIQPLFFSANAHFFVHFTVELLDSSLSVLSHIMSLIFFSKHSDSGPTSLPELPITKSPKLLHYLSFFPLLRNSNSVTPPRNFTDDLSPNSQICLLESPFLFLLFNICKVDLIDSLFCP